MASELEKNQFLRQIHGSEAKGMSPRDLAFCDQMRQLLYRFSDGLISEHECAITAATAAAQWIMKKRERRRAAQPSALDKLILPGGADDKIGGTA